MKEILRQYFLLPMLCCFSIAVFSAQVDSIQVYSAAMHKNIPCVVIVPEKQKKKTKDRFPVVYLLHGYSGSYNSWVKGFASVKDDADRYQMIIVCPDGAFGSWYFDSPLDSSFRYETFVAAELIAYIDQQYKTIPDKAHRGISGLSMGGHGAFYLSLKHKDIFGAVNSMSGGLDFRVFPDNWDIKKRLGTKELYPDNWEKNTVINMIDSLKKGELKIAFDCGVDDFFIPGNRAFNNKLISLGIPHDYTERPGGHTSEYWSNAIYYHLLFFHLFFNETH